MKKVAIIGLSGNSLFYNLDDFPKEGETTKAKGFHMEVGGKGYNQAIACKRLGLDVYYLSAIGNDINGKECIDYMEKEGVKHHFVTKETPTATASILKNIDSMNEVIVYHGANSELSIEDVKQFEKYIIESDCVLLNYEIPYDTLKYAIDFAKENNKLVILNPAPYIYDDLKLMEKADIICPNEVEFQEMLKCKCDNFSDIEHAYKKSGLKKIVITLGNKGCYICDGNEFTYIDAYRVKAVDTTGAGDVFNASLCYALLVGMSLIEACKFASKVAAISVTKEYVMPAIPKIDDIK